MEIRSVLVLRPFFRGIGLGLGQSGLGFVKFILSQHAKCAKRNSGKTIQSPSQLYLYSIILNIKNKRTFR